jgi:hypothetical protein
MVFSSKDHRRMAGYWLKWRPGRATHMPGRVRQSDKRAGAESINSADPVGRKWQYLAIAVVPSRKAKDLLFIN